VAAVLASADGGNEFSGVHKDCNGSGSILLPTVNEGELEAPATLLLIRAES